MFDIKCNTTINQERTTVIVSDQNEKILRSLKLSEFKLDRESEAIYLVEGEKRILLGTYRSEKAAIRVCKEVRNYLTKVLKDRGYSIHFPPINMVDENGEGFIWIFGN